MKLFRLCIILSFILPLACCSHKNNLKSVSSYQIVISEFMANNDSLAVGKDSLTQDWIELWNNSASSVSLEGLFLSDNVENLKKSPLTGTLQPNERIVLNCSGKKDGIPALDFKLNKWKGGIYLSDEDENVLHSVDYSRQIKDVSMVLNEDGWRYNTNPSPGTDNENSQLKTGLSQSVNCLFQVEGEELFATLSSPLEGKIYYTLDEGSPFSESAKRYSGKVKLKSEQLVRAIIRSDEVIEDKCAFFAHVPEDKHTLPVVKLYCEPENLFSEEKGIYHKNNCMIKHSDWVRTAYLEYSDADTTLRDYADIKIFGNATRAKPKKSFSVKSKTEMPNVFFQTIDEKELDGIILRSNYSGITKLRNELMYEAYQNADAAFDMQEYKPAALYLNGKYWGIYNIYERKNDEFVVSHHGVKPLSICKLNSRQIAEHKGDVQSMEVFLDSMRYSNSLSDTEVLALLEETFDMPSLIDFWAYELFAGRVDTYNNRFWLHPETKKWHIISFDYDIIFGKPQGTRIFEKFGVQLEEYKGLQFFNRAFQIEEFREKIFFRMTEIINSGFNEKVMTDFVYRFCALTETEFLRDTARWNVEDNRVNHRFRQAKEFARSINSFVTKRANFMFDSIFNDSGLTKRIEIVFPQDSLLEISVNGLPVHASCTYLAGMELTLDYVYTGSKRIDGFYFNAQKINAKEPKVFGQAGSIEFLFKD